MPKLTMLLLPFQLQLAWPSMQTQSVSDSILHGMQQGFDALYRDL